MLLPVKNAAWWEELEFYALTSPAYVYSAQALAGRITQIKHALGTDIVISCKACPNADLIARLPPDCLDGLELASRGELHTFAGFKPRHLYINTPALTTTLAKAGINARASFIVDTPAQVDLLHGVRGTREVKPIMLRLTNRLIETFNPAAPRLRFDQFGMDLDEAFVAIDRAKALGIPVEGVHLYGGPHTFGRTGQFVVEALAQIIPLIESRLGAPLAVVNAGGGLEENWPERGHDFSAYREALRSLPPHVKVVHEFGRALFASAGVFVARVIALKRVGGQRYAICDGGMAQAFLLAQTENMMRKYREPRIIGRDSEREQTGESTTLVGSTCSRDDVIGVVSCDVREGDTVVFDQCGAYVQTYSMNQFLTLGGATAYVV
ncbi:MULTISPECIES: hypothetical protein [unclassified Paraburkholderia]|uniref:hypothetical protein n=1 Tax=unclassified Paraburkholderia TaxID=2615204 RepID=UPI002AB135BD|nr:MULTISPECIES: hypothetical protein [unclassified Paraburkholderia]